MSLPFATLFPSRQEYGINVDFFDYSRNIGYVAFYPSKVNNGSWAVVSNTNFGSEIVRTEGTAEHTIDLTFNKPVDIGGDIFLSIPIGILANNSDFVYNITAKIYHYDGSTETQIGATTTGESYSMDTDPALQGCPYCISSIKITSASVVHFKSGEIFRVKLQMATTGGAVAFAHDPLNRSDFAATPSDNKVIFNIHNTATDRVTEIVTRQTWLIPFRLDI